MLTQNTYRVDSVFGEWIVNLGGHPNLPELAPIDFA